MRKLGLIGFLAAAALLAACGSSKSSTSAGSSTASTAAPSTQASSSATTAGAASGSATINLNSSTLGSILTDSQGRTLYMFGRDTATTSNCNSGCDSTWPPLTATSAPTAGAGLNAAKLTTISRSDGSKQVVYAGHPLYRYAADSKAGDTNGEGVGGVWFAVQADGSAAQKPAVGPNGY